MQAHSLLAARWLLARDPSRTVHTYVGRRRTAATRSLSLRAAVVQQRVQRWPRAALKQATVHCMPPGREGWRDEKQKGAALRCV
jgi:hypothetical protein